MATFLQVLNGTDYSLMYNILLEYKLNDANSRIEALWSHMTPGRNYLRWTRFGDRNYISETFVAEMEHKELYEAIDSPSPTGAAGKIRISDGVHAKITLRGDLASLPASLGNMPLKRSQETIFEANQEYRVAPFPDACPDAIVLLKFVHA